VRRWALLLVLLAACKPTKYDENGKPITLGKFRLRTYPKGAKVWIDGKLEVVSTPATIVKEAGEYHLKIQAPGAEPIERTITIEAGEQNDLNIRIPAPEPATVTVLSDIQEAEVRINGYKRGRTPLYRVVTKPGPIDVTVTGPNNQAKSVRATLKRSEDLTLEVFFYEVKSEPETGLESKVELPMSKPKPKGWLTLGMRPDGTVELDDGKKLGATPIVKRPMEAGKYTVWLRSKDDRYERRVTIEIEENKPAIYRFLLGKEDERPGWKPPPEP
jgi:hypothetical protein